MVSKFMARGVDFDDYFVAGDLDTPGYPSLKYAGGSIAPYVEAFRWRWLAPYPLAKNLSERWLWKPEHRTALATSGAALQENFVAIRRKNAPEIEVKISYEPTPDGVNGIRIDIKFEATNCTRTATSELQSYVRFDSIGHATSHAITTTYTKRGQEQAVRPDAQLPVEYEEHGIAGVERPAVQVGKTIAKLTLPSALDFGGDELELRAEHVVMNPFKRNSALVQTRRVLALNPKYDKPLPQGPAALEVEYTLPKKQASMALGLEFDLDARTYVLYAYNLDALRAIYTGANPSAQYIHEIASGDLQPELDGVGTTLSEYDIAVLGFSPTGRTIWHSHVSTAGAAQQDRPPNGYQPYQGPARSAPLAELANSSIQGAHEELIELQAHFLNQTNGQYFRRQIRLKVKREAQPAPREFSRLLWSVREPASMFSDEEDTTGNPLVTNVELLLEVSRSADGLLTFKSSNDANPVVIESKSLSRYRETSGTLGLDFPTENPALELVSPSTVTFSPTDPFDEHNPRTFRLKLRDFRAKDFWPNAILSYPRVTFNSAQVAQGQVIVHNEGFLSGKRSSVLRVRVGMARTAVRTAAQTYTLSLQAGAFASEWMLVQGISALGVQDAIPRTQCMTLTDRSVKLSDYEIKVESFTELNPPAGATISVTHGTLNTYRSLLEATAVELVVPGDTSVGTYDTHEVNFVVRRISTDTTRKYAVTLQINAFPV